MFYTVHIDVDVRDEKELYEAAFQHYCNENGPCIDVASSANAMLLNDDGTIDVSACLVQLADPGMSWPGTSIWNSTAEGGAR